MADPAKELASGRRLAHGTLWSVVGQIAPIAVALVAVPLLIRDLGASRFALLSLIWVLIGHLSLLDLGLGRGLTAAIADRLGARDQTSIASLAWTSLMVMAVAGLAGAVALWLWAPGIVRNVLIVPEDLQADAVRSFQIVAATLPVVVVTSGVRGILEAHQHFRTLALVRIPLSIASFAGPLAVLPWSRSLTAAVGALAVSRLVGLAILLAVAWQRVPELRQRVSPAYASLLPVIKLSGWMTVSNVISPFLVYLDRFLLGARLPIGAVTAYTASFDVVSRLTIVPVAMAGVLFPAFAMSAWRDPARSDLLFRRGVKYVFMAVFPCVALLSAFAPEGLAFWLGADIGVESTGVMRWLAAGVLMNCLALVPFSFIQGAGRPDLTATLHAIELPLYLLILWPLVGAYGIDGAAAAWTIRVSADAVALFVVTHRLFKTSGRFLSMTAAATGAAMAVLLTMALLDAIAARVAVVAIGLPALGWAMWTVGLSARERDFILRRATSNPDS